MFERADRRASLARLKGCEAMQNGLRIATDCLPPSFEQVHVYVATLRDGTIVNDDCAVAHSAWVYGVDDVTIAKDVAFVANA